MRMTVPRQETIEPDHIAMLRRPHDQRPAGAALDQTHAPQDQGPHDSFAKLRLRDQQSSQALRWDDQSLDRSLCVSINQRGSAGELSQFAQ
jgi:hypothetical protein